MTTWINLTLWGTLGGLLLFVVTAVVLGLGVGFESSEGELEITKFVDAPPISYQDAVAEITQGDVEEVVLLDEFAPPEEENVTYWYELESENDGARWQAAGLQVWVLSFGDSEGRMLLGPEDDVVGLSPQELESLVGAIDEANDTLSRRVLFEDARIRR